MNLFKMKTKKERINLLRKRICSLNFIPLIKDVESAKEYLNDLEKISSLYNCRIEISSDNQLSYDQ